MSYSLQEYSILRHNELRMPLGRSSFIYVFMLFLQTHIYCVNMEEFPLFRPYKPSVYCPLWREFGSVFSPSEHLITVI